MIIENIRHLFCHLQTEERKYNHYTHTHKHYAQPLLVGVTHTFDLNQEPSLLL